MVNRPIKKRNLAAAAAIIVCLLLAALAVLIYKKKISINNWWARQYPIKGIDISHHQGEIDWEMLKEQEIQFAYIKATEGSSHVDERFHENWDGAKAAEIPAGAYHFFSFESPAQTQAAQYISTVGDLSGNLVPVVDVEYYYNGPVPEKAQLTASLQEFLNLLEAEYGRKPIIYTTYRFYHEYIKETFDSYPLWIRNVYYPPLDVRPWTFWQYSDTGQLDGITGRERNVDLNVFQGDEKEFQAFLIFMKPETGIR